MSGRTLWTASSATSVIEDATSPFVSLSSTLPAATEFEQGGALVSPGAQGGALVSPAKASIERISVKAMETLSFLK